MTSGERLRILRILNGYSQQSLADEMGVSRASIMLWEKGKLPKRDTAIELAALFEVKVEYLLNGTNHPNYAVWHLTPPGHPKHNETMLNDLKYGMGLLFQELNISFTAKGVDIDDTNFWICGNNPEQPEWKLNYLLKCEPSLKAIVEKALNFTIQYAVDLESVASIVDRGNFIKEICNKLFEEYGHYPNCQNIYDRLGGLEGEGEDDFTLEGLLRRFGLIISRKLWTMI